jgi:AcrR family transcriptional regulator
MKRAVGDEQKNLRRDEILLRTAVLLSERDFESVTLSEVAASLGLVKGTLYRYFSTKEALVLEILEREMAQWLIALGALLGTGAQMKPAVLSTVLAQSLADRPLLVRLFSIVHVILEKNLSVPQIIEFKFSAAAVLDACAALLVSACPSLESRGHEAVLALYELAIGVGHLTGKSALLDAALQTPGLEVFQLDFRTQLEKTLFWTLTGLCSEGE